MGLKEKEVKAAIAELRRANALPARAEDTRNSLTNLVINLNKQAQSGKLDPVIGRDEEIRRVLQILSRRTKNNPILWANRVGKTAIAEGLAHRIISGDVPRIWNKRVYSARYGRTDCRTPNLKGEIWKNGLNRSLKRWLVQTAILFCLLTKYILVWRRRRKRHGCRQHFETRACRGEREPLVPPHFNEFQKHFEKTKRSSAAFRKWWWMSPRGRCHFDTARY